MPSIMTKKQKNMTRREIAADCLIGFDKDSYLNHACLRINTYTQLIYGLKTVGKPGKVHFVPNDAQVKRIIAAVFS